MLLFLLRNNRFRAEALVVLLLVIGMVPAENPSEGVCYMCAGTPDKCTKEKSYKFTCPLSDGYCTTITDTNTGTIERGCTGLTNGQCHIEAAGGEGCVDFPNDQAKLAKYNECKQRKIDEAKKEGNSMISIGALEAKARNQCVCKGHLCNADADAKANEAGGISPTSLLITIASALCIFLF